MQHRFWPVRARAALSVLAGAGAAAWTNQAYTPLERPDGATKAFYTAEEMAAIEQARAHGIRSGQRGRRER